MPLHTFDEVMRKAKRISHEETRRESEDYLEMVMFRHSLKEIESLFQGYFGSALKNAGQEAPDEAEHVAGRYGGIDRDQILYHAMRDSMRQVAMVWPWADGKRMTVKIIQESE